MPRPRKINTDEAAVKAAVETAMTPEPTPVKAEVEANPLLGLFERATEEQKDAMRKALGVQASVKALRESSLTLMLNRYWPHVAVVLFNQRAFDLFPLKV